MNTIIIISVTDKLRGVTSTPYKIQATTRQQFSNTLKTINKSLLKIKKDDLQKIINVEIKEF